MKEIAEDVLEQAKGLNFPKTIPTKVQEKGSIKELVRAISPAFKDTWRPIMAEYLFTAMNSHLGKPADEWGNLILVALTEHLKKKTGRPHHSLVIRTLKALRGKQLGSKRADTANGKSRVIQFKRRHKDWNNLLEGLEGK